MRSRATWRHALCLAGTDEWERRAHNHEVFSNSGRIAFCSAAEDKWGNLADAAEWGQVTITAVLAARGIGVSHLAALEHIEGSPEHEVLEHIQMHVAAATRIHKEVLPVLRPTLQLLPAE